MPNPDKKYHGRWNWIVFKWHIVRSLKSLFSLAATCQGVDPSVSFLSEELSLKGPVESEALIEDLICWQAC